MTGLIFRCAFQKFSVFKTDKLVSEERTPKQAISEENKMDRVMACSFCRALFTKILILHFK